MGGLQWRLLLKVPEECPSGFKYRGIGLALGVGEAVGKGGRGDTSMIINLKMG